MEKPAHENFNQLLYVITASLNKEGCNNMGLFGPDKITFTLEKYDYKPGDKIAGSVKLNLKKPTSARKLEISLIGRRKTTRRTSKGTQTSYETVYDFSVPLGGEQEYQDGQYSFEIPIPSDILYEKSAQQRAQEKLEDKLGAAGSIIGAVAMGGRSRINWSVRAQLDVPMKLDIKKSQDIVISE